MSKINLTVTVKYHPDGSALPLSIALEDGREFTIDKVFDRRKAASLKGGGLGMRYLCRICGKKVALFNDDGHWFIEK